MIEPTVDRADDPPDLVLDLYDTPQEAPALAATGQDNLVVIDDPMPDLDGLTGAFHEEKSLG